MENSQIHFCFDYKTVIVDEIALSGLDGVGFDQLWRLIENRISNTITNKMKERYWKFIVNNDSITLYINPEPMPVIEHKDRCSIIHPELGLVTDPPDYLDGPYEYNPIEGEYGSCANYETRTLLPKEDIKNQSFEKIAAQYNTLVMVASTEERFHALAPHVPIGFLRNLSTVQYCMLELVGRSRMNGQSTIGKSNLLKIDSDPKLLFYNRKILKNLDIVGVRNFTQWIDVKSHRAIIIRLKRFHVLVLHDYPTHGPIHDLCTYLLDQEDFTEYTDVLIQKKLYRMKAFKKTNKTLSSYLISFGNRTIGDRPITSKAKLPPKRRFMKLNIPSDDSSESEEEEATNTLTCQYKVKVDLLRQAYELFLNAGLSGLSINNLSILLGIEFYISRSICRTFTSLKLVRDFMDEKGKQKIYRYVAMTATDDFDVKYADEVKIYLKYLSEKPSATSDDDDDDDDNVPLKKIKLEETSEVNKLDDALNILDYVTELKSLEQFGKHKFESLLNSLSEKKGPTLRQLQYANTMLKIVNENKVVCGIYALGGMVGKLMDVNIVDYKCIKGLIQRLQIDKQIKLYRMTVPGQIEKQHILITLPNIKPSDDAIKDKFKDMVTKTMVAIRPKVKPPAASTPLTHFTYPRYIKIQKLHEIIVKSVYFNDDYIVPDNSVAYPGGFSSIIKLIPEFTVEFALGNISRMNAVELSHVNITLDLYPLKLRDVSQNILEALLNSDSFKASIKENLKALASMGLIQIIKDPSLGRKQSNMIVAYIFYVNRNPMILNTSGVWPRSCNKKDLEQHYYFETFEDVKQYWADVYNISTSTKIETENRSRKNLSAPARMQNEVYENDCGELFGDGLGPCGFDSSLHMDIKRLWTNFYSKMTDNRKRVLPNLKLNKNKVALKSKKIVKKKKKPESVKLNQKPVSKPIIKDGVKKRKTKEAANWWTLEEDKIIMFSKAAINVISPVSQPGCLIIRNGVAKDILTMFDRKKDSCNCHKRLTFLESNKSLSYLCDCIMNELRYRNLLGKYDGLLKNLRLKYSKNIKKVIAEARIRMLEIIWMMVQLDKSKAFMRKIPCVALNYEEFHKNFTISPAVGNSETNYKTKDDCTNGNNNVLKEIIIMTVSASYKNVVPAEESKKIYMLLKKFPESQLRVCLDQLRKTGAVSAKDKLINCQYYIFHFRDLTQSGYKLSFAYLRRWICRLNSEFVTDINNTLIEMPDGELKGSPGKNCVLLEHHSCNLIDVVTTTMPSILDADGFPIPESKIHDMDDVKLSFKSGCCTIRNKSNIKSFADHYKNTTQYESSLDELLRKCIVTVITDAPVKEEPKVISHLKFKGEAGSSFKDLLDAIGYDTDTLINKLRDLESKSIVKRVGMNENIIILTEFAKAWTMELDDQQVIPMPWLTFDLNIRYDILLKWVAVVANKVVESPGSSLDTISDNCEMLTTRAVQDICMLLQETECVTMKVVTMNEPSFFSDDDEKEIELTEYNEYEAFNKILVFPAKNSFSKCSWLIKDIADEYNVEL